MFSSMDERQNHFRVCQIKKHPTCNKYQSHLLTYAHLKYIRISVIDLIISNVQVVIKDLNEQNKYTCTGFIVRRNIYAILIN